MSISGMRMSQVVTLVMLPLIVLTVSLFIGRYPIAPPLVAKIAVSPLIPLERTWEPAMETVLFRVRLPRALAAMLVGAGLSVAGASFQGMFKNPLVSPQILGVSAGAGFGAAMGLLLSESMGTVQALAFFGGMSAVAFTYLISRIYRTTPILMLVLAGIVVGSLFSSLTSLIKYAADPWNKLPAIVFWLLGSFNGISLGDLLMVGPLILAGTAALLLVRWRINVLSLGEEEAQAMGVNTGQLRTIIIISATVVTAASVCISGIIGWVGLVIPHIARMVVGPDHRAVLPASCAIGASYLLVVDNISRSMLSTEIPIGILTSLLGAPVFAYLLRRSRTGWSS
ncbi:MAG: iron ABC transporter permease [Candidatus Methanofastidiosa archaeon]|nr:iron ABC transporter permease [Candidatus Methanofastidiosa archaeon]